MARDESCGADGGQGANALRNHGNDHDYYGWPVCWLLLTSLEKVNIEKTN